MDAARTLQTAFGGRWVEAVQAAAAFAPDLPAVIAGLNPSLLEQAAAASGLLE